MPEARAASQTAILVAAYRARATESGMAGCNDPWAGGLAGEPGLALSRRWDAHAPHMALWIALRTRYLDACVRAAIARGATQVVILGAGLDTRAARLSHPGVRFFEVDQPASQADKQQRLRRLSGYPLDAAVVVPCDFERDDFVRCLGAAGFDAQAPACFVWEGVVYYLHEPAARATLCRLATEFHEASLLVFDFLNSHIAKGTDRQRPEDRAMRGIVEDLGEPMHFGIDDAVPLLFESGFRSVRTVSFDELALQYTGTYARERFFRFQSIALASRGEEVAGW